MKTKTGNLISLLIIIGFVLFFSDSCKKDNSNNNPPSGGTVTDIDGNVYQTVIIGTQTWMASNLKTTKYRNGTQIPNVADSVQWSTLTTGAYCNNNNDPNTVALYGRFYNYYAVTDSNNIAPAGWHVPSDAEWTTLVTYLGSGAGGKLKSTGTTYWNSPNTGATNSTGFSGLPAGDRSYTGLFHYVGMYGCWWSTGASSATNAWEYVTEYNSSGVTRLAYSMGLGLSVRCVKN
jgi:uncharacterized protein (TIGR02145 family)